MNNDWYSVRSHLPEEGDTVILYTNGEVCEQLFYLYNGCWFDRTWDEEWKEVEKEDCWMPLPQGPSA